MLIREQAATLVAAAISLLLLLLALYSDQH